MKIDRAFAILGHTRIGIIGFWEQCRSHGISPSPGRYDKRPLHSLPIHPESRNSDATEIGRPYPFIEWKTPQPRDKVICAAHYPSRDKLDQSWINTTARPKPQPQSMDPQKQRLDGIRLLLAEDTPDLQFIFRECLEGVGAQVDIASNGIEAIASVRHGDYGLVLMDIQMPEMDGYEAALQLRKLGFDKPIIALTALVSREDEERCQNAGFDEYLLKPIDIPTLIKTVWGLVGKSHAELSYPL